MPEMQLPGWQPSAAPEPGPIADILAAMPPLPERAETETAATVTKWQPAKLNSRHREIMRRLLEGASYKEIAEGMGLHTQTIMLVATSKLFLAELSVMESEADFNVIKRAEAMSNEALDKLKTQMRFAKSESIQNKAANDILDRGGYAKVEKKLIGIVNGEEVIKELNRQRRDRILGSTNGNSRARQASVTSDRLDSATQPS